MARFINETVSIPAGQSLSSAVQCDGAPVFLHMPSEWTQATLSFQVSPDGVIFNDVYDDSGREMVFHIVAGASVRMAATWEPVLHMKVRSGSHEHPVLQEANRAIVITIDTSDVR